MTTLDTFDALMSSVSAGESVSADDLRALESAPDILRVGMLADAFRRSRYGARATYVRVSTWPLDAPASLSVDAGAGEVRIAGSPPTLDAAVDAVARAKAAAAQRPVSAYSWQDVERIAALQGVALAAVLTRLRQAGLDGFATLSLDTMRDPLEAIALVREAGFTALRLTIDAAPAAARLGLFEQAARAQTRHGGLAALNPLPMTIDAFKPTTGYDDVKTVALARLAAPAIPTIQVDWRRYGPKLAQVALTFGADDLDHVSASDDAPDGRRRAPLEDVRRNITAAGFVPIERDGRFVALA